MLARSLSVSIVPPDLDFPGPPFSILSSVSAHLPISLSLAASHPHAHQHQHSICSRRVQLDLPAAPELLYTHVTFSGCVMLTPLLGCATPALGALQVALLRSARGGGSRALRVVVAPATLELVLQWRGDDPDSETPLPTLEVPLEMLAVDLSLAPGAAHLTQACGQVRFFSSVAVCRAANGGSVSRVMKVPIRVYNNVKAPRACTTSSGGLLRDGYTLPRQAPWARHAHARAARRPDAHRGGPPRAASAHWPQGRPGSIAEFQRYAARLRHPAAFRGESATRASEARRKMAASRKGALLRRLLFTCADRRHAVSYDITKDAEHCARFVLGTASRAQQPQQLAGTHDFGVVSEDGGGGGLEWKVRLGVADRKRRGNGGRAREGPEGPHARRGCVRGRGWLRGRGKWGSAWRAPGRLGVLQRLPAPPASPRPEKPPSTARFLGRGRVCLLVAAASGGPIRDTMDDFLELVDTSSSDILAMGLLSQHISFGFLPRPPLLRVLKLNGEVDTRDGAPIDRYLQCAGHAVQTLTLTILKTIGVLEHLAVQHCTQLRHLSIQSYILPFHDMSAYLRNLLSAVTSSSLSTIEIVNLRSRGSPHELAAATDGLDRSLAHPRFSNLQRSPIVSETPLLYECYAFENGGHNVTRPSLSPENSFRLPANESVPGATESLLDAAAVLGIPASDPVVAAARAFVPTSSRSKSAR
ncbi:hypothetical protein GGX14DRAFT_658546 [Mycena pura]|uniref:Uncharacterized protein n=1 Tax=Mycena pura TaxID=153505 RepID=A0AAD6YMH2_9AGAR|nr:hypothetical protein GGX14DRAFT_658546 [Mycena pura]